MRCRCRCRRRPWTASPRPWRTSTSTSRSSSATCTGTSGQPRAAISMRVSSVVPHTKQERGGTENGLTARGSGRWHADAAESCSPTSTGAAGLHTRAAAGGGAGHGASRWQGARGAGVLEYGLGAPRRPANARGAFFPARLLLAVGNESHHHAGLCISSVVLHTKQSRATRE
jgi:hypothetical protein